VDLSGGDWVEPGGGLVEEQHRRIVEQRSGQRRPLSEALGERAAQIVGPVGQVDRPEGALDALLRVGQPVETGEEFEVLSHREAQVQALDSGMIEIRARIAGPFSALKGIPVTAADPEVGAMSVPSVLTVVVLPAPFGPRKPKTSP
jgi:hypothetical protein